MRHERAGRPGPARRPRDPPRVRLPAPGLAVVARVRSGTSCASRCTVAGCAAGCSTPTSVAPEVDGDLRDVLAVVVGRTAARRRRPVPLGRVALGRTARHVPARRVAAQRGARRRPGRARDRGVPGRAARRRAEPLVSSRPTGRAAIVARSRRRGRRRDRPVDARAPRRSSPRLERRGSRGACILGSEHPDAARTAHWDARPRGRVRRRRWPHRGVGAGARPRGGRRASTRATRRSRTSARPRGTRVTSRSNGRARVGAAVRVVTPAPTVDAVVALGEPTARPAAHAWPRVEVVDQRDEQPGHGAPQRRARRRAPPHASSRGARARCACSTARAGPAARVPHAAASWRAASACGATVRATTKPEPRRARAVRDRPAAVCLHCHGTHVPGRAARGRRACATISPRCCRGRRSASVDAATDDVPDADVLIGTEAVLHRVRRGRRSAWSPSSSSTRSCSRPAPGPPSRRSGCSCGARACSAARRRRRVLLLQTRLPEHEVVRRPRARRPAASSPTPNAARRRVPRLPAVRRAGRAQRRRRRGRRRVRRRSRRRG